MTKEICECGHDRRYHKGNTGLPIRVMVPQKETRCDFRKCPCKKFKPKNNSQQNHTAIERVGSSADTLSDKIKDLQDFKDDFEENIKISIKREKVIEEKLKRLKNKYSKIQEKLKSEEEYWRSVCKNYENKLIKKEKDVKEFIKREAKLLDMVINRKITWIEFWNKRNKIFGSKLA